MIENAKNQRRVKKGIRLSSEEMQQRRKRCSQYTYPELWRWLWHLQHEKDPNTHNSLLGTWRQTLLSSAWTPLQHRRTARGATTHCNEESLIGNTKTSQTVDYFGNYSNRYSSLEEEITCRSVLMMQTMTMIHQQKEMRFVNIRNN